MPIGIHSRTLSLGHLVGFALMFGICLVPAALFGGVLVGGMLHLPLRWRFVLVALVAAALAYGAVFLIGPASLHTQ